MTRGLQLNSSSFNLKLEMNKVFDVNPCLKLETPLATKLVVKSTLQTHFKSMEGDSALISDERTVSKAKTN